MPLLPTAVWGTQRLWTKGRPKSLTQRHVPITIIIGEPMEPTTDAALRERMQELLDSAQARYADSGEGQWWQPAHLGGTAPTPEEAKQLDAR